jgi:hypothetical protein
VKPTGHAHFLPKSYCGKTWLEKVCGHPELCSKTTIILIRMALNLEKVVVAGATRTTRVVPYGEWLDGFRRQFITANHNVRFVGSLLNDITFLLTMENNAVLKTGDLSEAIERFQETNKSYRTEGEQGVKNLEKLLSALGYHEHNFLHGTLIEVFLTDNPGAIEALIEWIGRQNIEDWQSNLEDETINQSN